MMRAGLLATTVAVTYVALRLVIPVLSDAGIPFEVRAALLALLPLLGWKLVPLIVR
jgi:hypothetical protein